LVLDNFRTTGIAFEVQMVTELDIHPFRKDLVVIVNMDYRNLLHNLVTDNIITNSLLDKVDMDLLLIDHIPINYYMRIIIHNFHHLVLEEEHHMLVILGQDRLALEEEEPHHIQVAIIHILAMNVMYIFLYFSNSS